jgi:hypothetical protein
VHYVPGQLVQRFEERDGTVSVFTWNQREKVGEQFCGKRLLLAAGALNTARIVLASSQDPSTRLPLLENPVSFVPFVDPIAIGTSLRTTDFGGAELAVVYDGPLSPEPIQGSIYNLNAPLRADLVHEFPLTLLGNIAASRYLLPAMSMLQLFYPDDPSSDNTLSLRADGSLHLRYEPRILGSLERIVISAFRAIGLLSHHALCRYPTAGSSIHYAGALPMRPQATRPYETDRWGRLYGTSSVHVVDAAAFPRLPSKNLTLSIMANAMRIAERVRLELTGAGTERVTVAQAG